MRSFSSFLTALVASSLFGSSTAAYLLEDDYTVDFFSQFDFFTGEDPTHGFVNYVDRATAQDEGLVQDDSDGVFIGVDTANVTSTGRKSVRITSKKAYNSGLIVLDLAHMPGSICGSWPAFWMVGQNWPNDGEIDIIEGVNDQTTNSMTLHTSAGCSITNNGKFSGDIETANCDVNAAGQSPNAGCSISTESATSYGDGFNAADGGVYATEWTDSHISIWYFPRSRIPADISSGNPNPLGWGTPSAMFQGGCDIPDTFKGLQLVFDVTFCGDWAGRVWTTGTCASKAATCNDFVANNPTAFEESFWQINSLKVFQSNEAYSGSSSFSAAPSASRSGSRVRSRSASAQYPQATQSGRNITVPAPTSLKGFSASKPVASSTIYAPATVPTVASSIRISAPASVPTSAASPVTVPTPAETEDPCFELAETVTAEPGSYSTAVVRNGTAVRNVLSFTTAWPQGPSANGEGLRRRACQLTTSSVAIISATATLAGTPSAPSLVAPTAALEASSAAVPAPTSADIVPAPSGGAGSGSSLSFTAVWGRSLKNRAAPDSVPHNLAAVKRSQHINRHRGLRGSGIY